MVARSLIGSRPYMESLVWTRCTKGPADSQLEQGEQALVEDLTLDSMHNNESWQGDQVELPDESQDVIADFLGKIDLDALINNKASQIPTLKPHP